MRPDSPGPGALASMRSVPTMPPSAMESTTKPSQPNVAVFQCAALQQPILAARLREGMRGGIELPSAVAGFT
jgi:hypothetical protein